MKDFEKNKNLKDPLKLLRYALGGETDFRKNLSVITWRDSYILRNKSDDNSIAIRYVRWCNEYSNIFRFKLRKGRIFVERKKNFVADMFYYF